MDDIAECLAVALMPKRRSRVREALAEHIKTRRTARRAAPGEPPRRNT